MRVVVGRIGRPHGIKGDVTIDVRTDDAEDIFEPGNVLLTESGPLTLESVRWTGPRLVVKFATIDDRNAAEEIRNRILEVDRDDDARPDDPDEFYDYHLIGLHVIDTTGVDRGDITEVIHTSAQDLLVVTDGDREALVPFVSEIVTDVDLAGRRVVIDPPEGLFEVNDAD